MTLPMPVQRTITLPCGPQQTVSFQLPQRNLLAVLSPPACAPAPDLRAEVRRALAQPIAARSLRELVRGKRKVVILADDHTRLTPTYAIVPELLDEMNAGGVRDGQITIIIALGTHRPMTHAEILCKFGRQVVERVRILNHNYLDLDNLVNLGHTPNGTPVSVSRLVVEADFSIGVGSVYPHHLPGMAGGAKIVQPGVSGAETTGATHLLGCRARPSYLGLVDNPVRRELNAVARRAGVHHILNTVQNEQGQTVLAFYGDLEAAFTYAAGVSRAALSVPVAAQADIVVAGSFPADLEFWQAHKTLYPADMAAKPGGTLIIVTPCPEGVAVMHPQMVEYTAWTAQEIEDALMWGRIADVPAAALAIAWAQVREGRQVSIVSEGLTNEEAHQLGFVPFTTVADALDDAFRRHGPCARVTVLPRAPETLPVLA
jgi:nickel-dependent lactate racemase